MGLMSVPAVSGSEALINRRASELRHEIPDVENLPPEVRREIAKIEEQRKSAYRRCQVHARSCGLKCIEKYPRDKNQQALCFKGNRCQSDWENCVDQIQENYPLDLLKVPGYPESTATD